MFFLSKHSTAFLIKGEIPIPAETSPIMFSILLLKQITLGSNEALLHSLTKKS